jgi:hypothetical protein
MFLLCRVTHDLKRTCPLKPKAAKRLADCNHALARLRGRQDQAQHTPPHPRKDFLPAADVPTMGGGAATAGLPFSADVDTSGSLPGGGGRAGPATLTLLTGQKPDAASVLMCGIMSNRLHPSKSGFLSRSIAAGPVCPYFLLDVRRRDAQA